MADECKIKYLPDELLTEIFQFTSDDPRVIYSISRTCKCWQELTNHQRVWDFTKLYQTDDDLSDQSIIREEVKCRILNLIVDYFLPNLTAIPRPFTNNNMYGEESKKSTQVITSRALFVSILKNRKKVRLNRFKFTKLKSQFNSNLLDDRIEFWFCAQLTFILVLMNFCLGLFGSISEDQRSLETGLWWLPVVMSPFYILIAFSYLVWFMLLVLESIQVRRARKGEIYFGFILVTLFSWNIIGVKHHLYNLSGIQLSYWQEVLFPTSYFSFLLPFHLIVAIFILSCLDRLRWKREWDITMDLISYLGFEISLLMFSFPFLRRECGNLFIFSPLICGGILKTSNDFISPYLTHYRERFTVMSFIPICVSFAVWYLVNESFNYWSLIPLILVFGRKLIMDVKII